MSVCMNGYYGACHCYGLVRQISGSLLSVSVRKVHVVFLSAGFKGVESRLLRHVKLPLYEWHQESLAQLAEIEPKPLVH